MFSRSNISRQRFDVNGHHHSIVKLVAETEKLLYLSTKLNGRWMLPVKSKSSGEAADATTDDDDAMDLLHHVSS